MVQVYYPIFSTTWMQFSFLDTVFYLCYNKEKVLGVFVHERKDPYDTGERSI